jgi:hypothetical protein
VLRGLASMKTLPGWRRAAATYYFPIEAALIHFFARMNQLKQSAAATGRAGGSRRMGMICSGRYGMLRMQTGHCLAAPDLAE